MFAIIQTGGKQYRVQEGDVIRVEKLPKNEAGDKLDLTALMVGGEQTLFGADAAKFTVNAEVVDHGKLKKIYIRKYKSGVQYRRRTGHRQQFTALRITGIQG
ncbi:50S ribosomal protein L21 [Deinococcus sp.]|uniref:50S ribosomal protein L21 n=1 Tax=Deinococcus sp. TaxID=47478 RepID=UPI0025E63B17|nr:50S ribosomal protein L21 [Deinococcus sp.]